MSQPASLVVKKRSPILWALLSLLIIPAIIWLFQSRRTLMQLSDQKIAAVWWMLIPLYWLYWWGHFCRVLIWSQARGGYGVLAHSLLLTGFGFSTGLVWLDPLLSDTELIIGEITSIALMLSAIFWAQAALNQIIDQPDRPDQPQVSRFITLVMLAQLLIVLAIVTLTVALYIQSVY